MWGHLAVAKELSAESSAWSHGKYMSQEDRIFIKYCTRRLAVTYRWLIKEPENHTPLDQKSKEISNCQPSRRRVLFCYCNVTTEKLIENENKAVVVSCFIPWNNLQNSKSDKNIPNELFLIHLKKETSKDTVHIYWQLY